MAGSGEDSEVSSAVVTASSAATGASLTGVTVIVTVAALRVDGAVAGREGEAVGAVEVGSGV